MKFSQIAAHLDFARQLLNEASGLSGPALVSSALMQLEFASALILSSARGPQLTRAIEQKLAEDEAFARHWPEALAGTLDTLPLSRQEWQNKNAGLIATNATLHWTSLKPDQLISWLNGIEQWLQEQRELHDEY